MSQTKKKYDIPYSNDEERRQWVLNDEGLYNWYISERVSMTKFIREHRDEIDAAIERALNPQSAAAREQQERRR